MADDTTIRTVEEAKRFAMHVAASYCSGDLRFDQFNDAMDALIAAVRAENAPVTRPEPDPFAPPPPPNSYIRKP